MALISTRWMTNCSMKLTLRLRVYLQAHQTPRTAAKAAVGLVTDLLGVAEAREQLSEARISNPASQTYQIQTQQLAEQVVEVVEVVEVMVLEVQWHKGAESGRRKGYGRIVILSTSRCNCFVVIMEVSNSRSQRMRKQTLKSLWGPRKPNGGPTYQCPMC